MTRMAAELSPRLAGANPVVLAVMYGGAFTALELCRRFDFPHEFDYVHPTSYVRSEIGGELTWRVRPAGRLAGRTVLVVDDILDRGLTLHALHAELDSVGVTARLTAVLVRKRVARRERRPRIDAFGVEVDDVYVFGCGMDYRGYWRSLEGIYALGSEP
jgi:hypoxanthine phosphoribosyltransferase